MCLSVYMLILRCVHVHACVTSMTYYVAMEFDKYFVLPENLTDPLCLCDSVFPGNLTSILC